MGRKGGIQRPSVRALGDLVDRAADRACHLGCKHAGGAAAARVRTVRPRLGRLPSTCSAWGLGASHPAPPVRTARGRLVCVFCSTLRRPRGRVSLACDRRRALGHPELVRVGVRVRVRVRVRVGLGHPDLRTRHAAWRGARDRASVCLPAYPPCTPWPLQAGPGGGGGGWGAKDQALVCLSACLGGARRTVAAQA